MLRRASAERFGVVVASAVRWAREWRGPDRHGRRDKTATCGRSGLKPIATLFSARSTSGWTSRSLNWEICLDSSLEPYSVRARSGVSLIVTR